VDLYLVLVMNIDLHVYMMIFLVVEPNYLPDLEVFFFIHAYTP
jgi:hypothetical protein